MLEAGRADHRPVQAGERATLGEIKLLSVGTGVSLQYINGQDHDWGDAQWMRPILNVMMDGSVGVADFACKPRRGPGVDDAGAGREASVAVAVPPPPIPVSQLTEMQPIKDIQLEYHQPDLPPYPGHDQFRFRLVGKEKTILMDFPNHSTHFDGDVEAFLLTEFKETEIEVEALVES